MGMGRRLHSLSKHQSLFLYEQDSLGTMMMMLIVFRYTYGNRLFSFIKTKHYKKNCSYLRLKMYLGTLICMLMNLATLKKARSLLVWVNFRHA